MRSLSAPAWAACCLATGLLLSVLRGAEPPHPLMGATRDDVLARYGEPKGQISVGARMVLTYPKEKLILRNNVVVEVEPVAAEPVRRSAPPLVEAAAPGTATGATPSGSNESEGAPNARPNPPAARSGSASTMPSEAAPAPEPKVEIKFVRAPSAGGAAPQPRREIQPPAVAEPPQPEPVAEVVPQPPKPDPAEVERAARAAAKAAQDAAKAAAEAAAQEKRLKSAQSARRRLDFAETAETDEGSVGKYVYLGLGVLVVGIGALSWWRRQQALELAATSVANTPVKKLVPATPSAAAGNGLGRAPLAGAAGAASAPLGAAARTAPAPALTAEYLAQLDANRFEDFVAAYFTKTGVVATRTRASAVSPLHIRISWKGAPRAFASVHCIPQETGEVDARALHGFAAALAAEDLRRGYVVTSGHFSSSAQKVAADKHLTLLPIDGLLEKIQGLSESARKELIGVLSEEKKAA